MKLKTQKSISVGLICLVAVGGLQSLIYILNLNQTKIFLHVAGWVYFYLVVKMFLLYDLHFKNPGALERARIRHESVTHWLLRSLKIILSAFWDRIRHVRQWSQLRLWLVYLILPGVLYWSTVCIFYLHLGGTLVQQTAAWLSAAAIVFTYWHLKEIFASRLVKLEKGPIAALTVIKLYAVFLMFSAAVGLTRRFCLEWNLLAVAIFALTFLLMYQALFQHGLLKMQSTLLCVLFACILTLLGLLVFFQWGLNYFTAGALLMVWYNFFWNILHHYLDNSLTPKSFLELAAVTLLVTGMLMGATNFRARVLGSCEL